MSLKSRYYNKNGIPISMYDWVGLLADKEYKVVGSDKQETDVASVNVSTVWLGLDHNYSDHGPPIIFETMVFRDQTDNYFDEEICFRYSTERQALAGHDICVYNAWRWIRGIPCPWDMI